MTRSGRCLCRGLHVWTNTESQKARVKERVSPPGGISASRLRACRERRDGSLRHTIFIKESLIIVKKLSVLFSIVCHSAFMANAAAAGPVQLNSAAPRLGRAHGTSAQRSLPGWSAKRRAASRILAFFETGVARSCAPAAPSEGEGPRPARRRCLGDRRAALKKEGGADFFIRGCESGRLRLTEEASPCRDARTTRRRTADAAFVSRMFPRAFGISDSCRSTYRGWCARSGRTPARGSDSSRGSSAGGKVPAAPSAARPKGCPRRWRKGATRPEFHLGRALGRYLDRYRVPHS